MTPREVAIGRDLRRRRHTPPPPFLQVNKESRSHLLRFYTRCFPGYLSRRLLQTQRLGYFYVNLDIDIIYCNTRELSHCDAELPLIQRLILECEDAEYFFYKSQGPLHSANMLKEVTILDVEPSLVEETWWMAWTDLMLAWYYRDDPVQFTARIVAPDAPNDIEVRPENYLELDREQRRTHAPTPEEDPEYEGISDSEDDVDAPWRFVRWRHVDGCECASRKKVYVQFRNGDGKSSYRLCECSDGDVNRLTVDERQCTVWHECRR